MFLQRYQTTFTNELIRKLVKTKRHGDTLRGYILKQTKMAAVIWKYLIRTIALVLCVGGYY